MAEQLHELGYRHMRAQSLKPKHVEALVKHWQGEGLSPGAMKNRLAAMRWWAQKVNRQNVVARSNGLLRDPEPAVRHRYVQGQVGWPARSGQGA